MAVGVALGALAVIGIGAMLALRPEPAPRDPETMCPDAGPGRITAILVDTTDRIGPTSRADILGRLNDLVSSSQPDELMMAYETAPVAGDDLLQAPLAVCNPGDPDDTNPLIASPELIRQRLEDRFRKPLAARFEDLLNRRPAESTPLMENLQALSVTVFARPEHVEIPKRLIIVSDLMQHTEHLSFYDRQPDYDAFSRTRGADALRTDLKDVQVEVLFIQRSEHVNALNLIGFWERWVTDQGGRFEKVDRIAGLN